ncbi:Tetratricopeptide repeat protein [Novipirellula galeiformis]|uniref:Tetratricopeptide repeat protein n=2 Tax=Novipirellula galeiformis TaxID=2528004 RepID=A0A5C6CIH4_9BACT|nr:Tetratricopeptide repeat protein [Novipirellula galeiformis]
MRFRVNPTSFRPHIGTVLVSVASLLGSPQLSMGGSGDEHAERTGAATPPSEVAELIDQLGSESYATRIRARDSLAHLGLQAFDELHIAQYHPDSEIAMTARHLVSSLLVSWSQPSDSDEVREILHEYGARNIDERRSRIERLVELPEHAGLRALIRLTRFETSLDLSRVAALAVMQQEAANDAKTRKQHAEQIRTGLSECQRAAATWLFAYADDLENESYDAERWSQLIAKQRSQLDTASALQTTRDSVLELVRVCVRHAWLSDKVPDALALAKANLDLIPPTTRDLTQACGWAIENGLHPIVLELRDLHRQMFETQPMLLYSAAEALKANGDVQQASQLADQAILIRPLPRDKSAREKLSPNELEETAQAHREIAQELQNRGLFEWSEREFRAIIDHLEIDSSPSVVARDRLALMLSELQRHQEVVDLLTPLIDRIESDDQLKNRLNLQRFSYEEMRSHIQWHLGLLKIQQGDPESAKPMLEKAYQLKPDNIDILISMYQLEQDDPAWTAKVDALLEQSIRRTMQEITSIEVMMKQKARFQPSGFELAKALNQHAWLVSNTKGNYEQALRYSIRSLELKPNDSALLDTCARCYFATGDFKNAVATQRRAIRLTPHSPPMIRQLEAFEAKLRSTQ